MRTSLIIAPALNPDFTSVVSPSEIPAGLSHPSIISVPRFPACTKVQLKAKIFVWPCLYSPKQPTDAEAHTWTSEEIDWAEKGMARAVEAAQDAQMRGEVKYLIPCPGIELIVLHIAWDSVLRIFVPAS
jgi:hypothetical protein